MSALRATLVLCSMSFAGLALGQPPNEVTHESTITAKVTRIERSSRVVTLQGEGNVLETVYVDPTMTEFESLKVGDVVTVRLSESVIVQVRPNAKLRPMEDTTQQARKTDKDVVSQQTTTVKIEEIDSQGLFLVYRTHDNRKVVHHVRNKELLEGVRPGDRVEVTLTRARALAITKAR